MRKGGGNVVKFCAVEFVDRSVCGGRGIASFALETLPSALDGGVFRAGGGGDWGG